MSYKFETADKLPENNALPPLLLSKDGAKITTAEE